MDRALKGELFRVRISGFSMLPTLNDGDEVLAEPMDLIQESDIGSILVLKHPFDTSLTLVKRLAAIEDKRLRILGDNPPESTDSRSFGLLPPSAILGKVVAKLSI